MIFNDTTKMPLPDQRCPLIGFIHGLDWIGSDDCYVQNFDGLCFFSAKQTITLLLFLLFTLANIDYEQSSTMSWLDLAINMQH